jgi:hypothetical protein
MVLMCFDVGCSGKGEIHRPSASRFVDGRISEVFVDNVI